MNESLVFKSVFFLIMVMGFGRMVLAAPFAYVPNEGNATLSVVDMTSMEVVDTLPYRGKTGKRITGFVFDQDGKSIYVVDTLGNVLGSINLGLGTADRRITATEEPEGISLSPDSRHIAICANRENAVVVIDAVTLSEVWRIQVQGKSPDRCLYSPDGKWLLAGSQESDRVDVLDVAARNFAAQIKLAGPGRGFGFSADGKAVFISNATGRLLEMIDTARWKVVRGIPAGLRGEHVAIGRSLKRP